ncbi:oxidoreductase [Alteromonas sp. I4]|nr:oxidoreductase [Alteromonas sp. I4]
MNTTLLTSLFTSNAGLSALVLRVPVGIVLAAHGAQKLFAWFGGYGLEGTGQYMESIGLAPGFLMALLAGSAEFFGGLALVLGVLTRPAALVSAFTMLMAIFTAHISNGLFLSNGGYEYALALFAASLSLVFSGAGRLAVDNLIANKFASAQ